MTRVPITLMLPEHVAEALLHAAECAYRIDAQGRVVMDHFILARDPAPLQQTSEMPFKGRESKPSKEGVQTLLEAHFNGA